jgi:hypothetical protein
MEGLDALPAAARTNPSLDDLQPFLTSWSDTGTWQNSETAQATYDQSAYALPPWMLRLDISGISRRQNSLDGEEEI